LRGERKAPQPARLVCPRCGKEPRRKAGSVLAARGRVQRYQCLTCGKKYHRPLRFQPVQLREGYFDIEATGLKANFDIMLCYSIKPRGEKGIITRSILDYEWSMKGEKALVRQLIKDIKRFDMLVTYNGTYYDIPFIRSRALRHGLKPPEYMELYHRDLYFVAKSRLSAHRKNLGTVAPLVGVRGKTDIDPKNWEAAVFGDKRAIREIIRHNIGDVEVLAEFDAVMEPYYQGTNRSI